MTSSSAILDDAGGWTTAVAAGVATTLCLLSLARPLSRWSERRGASAEEVRRRLRLSRPLALTRVGGPFLAAGVFLAFLFVGLWLVGAVTAFVLWRGIEALPRAAVTRRRRRFEGQLGDALVMLSNSLKAGLSLPQAVKQVAADMSAPASEEFAQVHREYELGKPIEQALEDARARVGGRNFDLAVVAFRVGKERGGNVAEVFDRIAASVREAYRLEAEIKTVSTQGRSSARFMSLMPVLFLGLLFLMDAEGTALLFTDPTGIVILTGVIVCNLLGHLWIRQIVAVDV